MKADVAVAEWAERFPRPAASTTANNASQAKHFGTFFDGRELKTITREEFRRYALVHPGAARYARTMLGDYLDARLIEENVADGVSIPRRPTKAVVVPTAEEIDLLEKHSDRLASDGIGGEAMQDLGRMIRLAAYTGLREGELRALARSDILYADGEKLPRRLRVEYSMSREEKLKDPKTAASEATIAILNRKTQNAVHGSVALAHRGRQSPVRAHRLFLATRGQRQRAWEMTRRRAGVSLTWHSLRHFCATYLLDNDAAIDDVALQLRCSVEEVRNTYGHPNREAALSRLEAIVDGA